MGIHEVVLPETTPETEWVRGRALQKVSPRRAHARVQGCFFTVLDAWARGRGDVGTEWRFRIQPPGEVRRPLVPDVAYVSTARMRGLVGEDREVPPLAPDVAVEVLSPDDRPADVAAKVRDYLSAGSALVIVLDPDRRIATLHDPETSEHLAGGAQMQHPALPGFHLDLAAFFADALGP